MTRPQPLDKFIDDLTDEVIRGKTHLAIFRGLQSIDDAVRFSGPTFFEFTLFAHLNAAEIYATKVFDSEKQKKAATIHSMLTAALKNENDFRNASVEQVRTAVSEARAKVLALGPILKPLYVRRNSSLAHLSLELVFKPENLAKHYRLNLTDFEGLFSKAAEILNDMKILWDGIPTVPNLPGADDYGYVLELVGKALCHEIREHEKEFGYKHTGLRPRGCE
jgi:hypothetical protein